MNCETQHQWSVVVDGCRVYAPARAALHARLLGREARAPSGLDRPRAVVFAGGAASGKTTLVSRLRPGADRRPDPTVIDPDRFKTHLPEFSTRRASGRAAQEVHEESVDLALQLLARAIATRSDLIIDIVGGGGKAPFAEQVTALLALGYDVELRFADVPLNVARSRAARRGAATGRYLAPSALEQSHRRAAASYLAAARLPTRVDVHVYACEGRRPRLIELRTSSGRRVIDAARAAAFAAKAGL